MTRIKRQLLIVGCQRANEKDDRQECLSHTNYQDFWLRSSVTWAV